MRNSQRQKGAARPLWIGIAVITCVVVGSTFNKCVNCFSPSQAAPSKTPVAVRGERMDAPVATEPELELEPEPVVDEAPVSATVADWGDPEPVPEKPAPATEPVKEAPAETPAAPAVKKTEHKKPKHLGEFLDLTFDKLASFVYEFVEEGEDVKPKKDQIPQNIKALHEKSIAIKGFMIPLKNDGEDVVEFVLVRNQGACCWGIVPRMNEWIHVKMEPEKVAPYALDVPITVFGKLEVGEVYENGLLMSLYRMESGKVVEPELFK